MDGVYYDLGHEAVLGSGAASQVEVTELPDFATTSLGLVSHLEGAQELANGVPVAQVMITDDLGAVHSYLLRAGMETSEGEYDQGRIRHNQAKVCRHWPDNPQGKDYVTRLEFGKVVRPQRLAIEYLAPMGRLHLRGASLVDDRTHTFAPLVVSTEGRFRLVHSGDVKIYENLDGPPRAFVVHQVQVLDDEAAIAAMKDPIFRPEEEVILAPEGPGILSLDAPGGDRVEILTYKPEHIVISADLEEEGYLVLTDTYYPGWRAVIDGLDVPIHRADLLFRAVYLPAGQHRVEFVYDPLSLKVGAAISLVALLALLVGLAKLLKSR